MYTYLHNYIFVFYINTALNNDAHPCDCHEKAWKNNPLSYFHQGTVQIWISVYTKVRGMSSRPHTQHTNTYIYAHTHLGG